MTIAGNINDVFQRISDAKTRVRRTDAVRLCAVTKKATAGQMIEAIIAGARLIGENRVKAAAEKFPGLPPVEKHMIGHLQTNKVKQAVKLFDCIQSVDSLKLAKEIDKRADSMQVMIEVNISKEEQRFGIKLNDAEGFYDKLKKLENIEVVGLMAMAPYILAEETRSYFQQMKKLQETLGLPELSIGMTNDFEVAVEEGSTMVRVGTAIFS